MSDTAPPPLPSVRREKLFGGVLGCGMMGSFLGAGLIAMLLPLPHRFEGFRDPLAVAFGVGSILFFVVVGMVPVYLNSGEEGRRLDRLFGSFGLLGASDPGHGRVYRGEHQGRETTVACMLTGGNAFARNSKASFSVSANIGLQALMAPRGTPALNMARPAGRKHVLLLDRKHIDIRASHPALIRALADDPAWADVDGLLAGISESPGVLVFEPEMVQALFIGPGATTFDVPDAQRILRQLGGVANALERLGPASPPSSGTSWLSLSHTAPTAKRWQQWAMSLGCLTLVTLGWLAWVLAIAIDAGLVPGL